MGWITGSAALERCKEPHFCGAAAADNLEWCWQYNLSRAGEFVSLQPFIQITLFGLTNCYGWLFLGNNRWYGVQVLVWMKRWHWRNGVNGQNTTMQHWYMAFNNNWCVHLQKINLLLIWQKHYSDVSPGVFNNMTFKCIGLWPRPNTHDPSADLSDCQYMKEIWIVWMDADVFLYGCILSPQ